MWFGAEELVIPTWSSLVSPRELAKLVGSLVQILLILSYLIQPLFSGGKAIYVPIGGRGFFTQSVGPQRHTVEINKESAMQSIYEINKLSFYYTCGFL